MMGIDYLEVLTLAAPEAILVATALAVLTSDLVALRHSELRTRLTAGAIIACAGCAAAIAWIAAFPMQATVLGGMLVLDPLTAIVKIALLVLAGFATLLSLSACFTEHVGEYFALILLATVGMLLLISTEDLLMVFVALELTSLSLYILAGFDKRDARSAEAALKYFLFGGIAAAFTLYGFSLLYGAAGSTNLRQISVAVAGSRLDPLVLLAIVMTLAGFGFKIAAAPFHFWVPDTYEGAPIPSAAFIASGSKVAGFFILAKLLVTGLGTVGGSGGWHEYRAGWIPALAAMAATSMVLGNVAALVQSSVRRLLAYSAVAHAGYVLPAILTNTPGSFAALLYYVFTYALTAVGAFGVVAVVQAQSGSDRLSDFAGLSRRSPWLAFCMVIFLLSLAGIPPLAGFFGKFYVFASALSVGGQQLPLLWLVVLAIAMSAVSLYYYLQVLKQIYVVPARETNLRAACPVITQLTVGVLALAVVVLGVAPEPVVSGLKKALSLAGY